MYLNKKSFIVTFHASLVAKGVLELNEVSEGNNLRLLVGEILDELNGNTTEEQESPQYTTSSIIDNDGEIVEEIDPIDEEHMVEDSVEDSEVQGEGRATEVDPQEEDPENPSTAQGGTLPNQ